MTLLSAGVSYGTRVTPGGDNVSGCERRNLLQPGPWATSNIIGQVSLPVPPLHCHYAQNSRTQRGPLRLASCTAARERTRTLALGVQLRKDLWLAAIHR